MFETQETRPDYKALSLTLAVSILNGNPNSVNCFSPTNLSDAALRIAKAFYTFLSEEEA